MIVAEYVAKFEELDRYCPHYNGVEAEGSMCVKFENDLRSKIKQFIGYLEIRHFSMSVKKCRIYDEDNITKSSHYKSANEKKCNSES